MVLKKPVLHAQNPQPDDATPYKPGDGGYNRESGKKTLYFVAAIILLIAIFSLCSLYLLNTSAPFQLLPNKTTEKTK